MIPKLRTFSIVFCVFTSTCLTKAQSPTLSISSGAPGILRFSWPSNFTDWRLMSTTNLARTYWRPVPLVSFPSNDVLIVTLPVTDLSRYFRLEPLSAGPGECVFQATPAVINSGQSSTLTWCPLAGYTYRLSPGPVGGGAEVVTGGSVIVSPTNTTVYTLNASNLLGVATTDSTTLICNPCGWLSATNLMADLDFDYDFEISTAAYNFSVSHHGVLTFHLQRLVSTDTDAYYFGFTTEEPVYGIVLDRGRMKDREDDKTGPRVFTTTETCDGPSVHELSTLSLHMTCTTLDFSFNIAADTTEVTDFGTYAFSEGLGTGQVAARQFQYVRDTSISGYAYIPAAYPPSSGDYFVPSSDVGKRLFTSGTVSAPNAGRAQVGWSFYVLP
jgi:hypothetical protein